LKHPPRAASASASVATKLSSQASPPRTDQPLEIWGKQARAAVSLIGKWRDGGGGSPPPPHRLLPPPALLAGAAGGGRAAANPAARHRRAEPPLRHLQLRQAAAQQRPRAHSADGVAGACLCSCRHDSSAFTSVNSVLQRCVCAGGTAGISSPATLTRRSSARQVRFRLHRGLRLLASCCQIGSTATLDLVLPVFKFLAQFVMFAYLVRSPLLKIHSDRPYYCWIHMGMGLLRFTVQVASLRAATSVCVVCVIGCQNAFSNKQSLLRHVNHLFFEQLTPWCPRDWLRWATTSSISVHHWAQHNGLFVGDYFVYLIFFVCCFTSSDDCWSYVKRGKQVMGCFGSMFSQILCQFAFADMR
jgi:hypothetical protein